MTLKIINVGTVANDGTGDTIRGAFTNVNANFIEVYANIAGITANIAAIDLGQNTTIEASYTVANSAFNEANSANILAYNVGFSANLFSVSVGSSGNAYAVSVGASSNSYAQSVGTASNNYTSILVANNAVGINAWANAVGTASNNWTLSNFTTLSNTAIVYTTANASFAKANAALANTSGTFQGNLITTGSVTSTAGFFDRFGPIREPSTFLVSTDATANGPYIAFISNSTSSISINIPDDNIFIPPANIGATIEIYQYGTGNTKIVANDASVTIYSSNNWANIAGQYLSAKVVKVSSNTWILTGDLKV